MTTIAYDGKTICTDSQVSSRDVRFGTTTKLWKLESGALFAVAGDIALGYAVMLWLDQKAEKPTSTDDEQVAGILIETDGSAWEYSGKAIRRFPACVPWATGSGEVIAMTAMRCGKTAREAVELACEMDANTSGPVQTAVIGDVMADRAKD